MRFSLAFGLLVLSLGLASSVWASESCPLSNPAYSDIRLAAAKLQEKLTLPPGCERVESELQGLGTNVKKSIDELYDLQASELAEEGVILTDQDTKQSEKAKIKLKTAVDGIQSISSVFSRYSLKGKNSCGKVLLTNLDYIEALIDTVNGLAPYFIVFGGSKYAPVVLGATLIGSIGKTFMTLFHSNVVDMKDAKQRRIFIENSCAFHDFNRNYEALQNRGGQREEARAEMIALKKKVAELEQVGAPSIAAELRVYAEADAGLKEDQAALKSYQELAATFDGVDLLSCNYVRGRIQSDVHRRIADRLTALLDLSERAGHRVAADRPLVALFLEKSAPDHFPTDYAQLKSCADYSRMWLRLAGSLLSKTDQELSRPGRRDVTFKEYAEWEAARNGAKLALKKEEARAKWLASLSETGESIENSEISQARDDSRDALFITQNHRALFGMWSTNQESPAQLWLESKRDASRKKLVEFEQGVESAKQRWPDYLPDPKPEMIPTAALKREACAQMRAIVSTWSAARNHASAAVAFCGVFRDAITDVYYPEVSNLCFGKFDFKKRQYGRSPLDVLTEEVAFHEPRVQQLNEWMTRFSCPAPRKLEPISP